ncbi:hypothetical protein AURDEDRAFT_158037 [Auricularia subglabra TFB-10046 SS5]|nr:hypothetical protein AURDEDRAFT_158037 [Auricularia subglabra TFB-10046 SS5]
MSPDRRILWHPRAEHQFIACTAAQLALYAWDEEAADISLTASTQDVAGLKCFAWSPTQSCDDLIAVGIDSGRVDLLRLSQTAPLASNAGNTLFPSAPVASFLVRGAQRACNAIAFSTVDPNLMACGMDKSKAAPGLVIWDIESAFPQLSIDQHSQSSPSTTPLPRASLQKSGDPRIVQPHAPTDGFTSVAFMPHSSRLLAAAVSSRWLRLYDLRAPQTSASVGTPPRQGACKSISDIVVDPLDSYRIASFGDDAVIRVWDYRSLALPVLTFSERDALSDGARARGGMVVSAIEFSPARRGLLASLEKEAPTVRFWDIVQGESVNGDHNASPNTSDAVSSKRSSGWRWTSSTGEQDSLLQISTGDEERTIFHLADTHRSRRFARGLASFAFVPGSSAKQLVGLSREGDIEFSSTADAHVVAWSARGELGVELGRRFRVYQPVLDEQQRPWDTPAPPPEPVLRLNGSAVKPPTTFGRGDDDGFPALAAPPRLTIPRPHTQMYSPASIGRIPLERAPGDATPRAGATIALPAEDTPTARFAAHTSWSRAPRKASKSPGARASSAVRGSSKSRVPAGQKSSVRVVRDDISVVMRRRVLRGYGLDSFALNASITRDDPAQGETMQSLWKWMEHSRNLFPPGGSSFHGYDFSFRGLLAIWEGFEPAAAVAPYNVPLPPEERSSLFEALNTDGALQESPPSVRSLSKRPVASLDGGYAEAVARVNDMSGSREYALEKVMVITAKPEQRRLALAICGWDLDDVALNDRIAEFEKAGLATRAACWAMFSNQHAKALEILMFSADERHRIMSGMLAALLPPNSGERRSAKEHYERVIVRLEDPYLRIMLLHAALGDWDEVVREESLPLQERLAIAFCFLDDRALSSYLRARADGFRHTTDVEGLILTGLTTRAGMDILDAFVDIVGDVQTAALLTSHVICPPLRRRGSGSSMDSVETSNRTRDEERLYERAERWAEAYRGLLDSWRLFDYRCKFDILRGQMLSDALASRGGPAEAPYPWVPGQLRVRCNTCKKLLDTGVEARSKGMQCPTCKRPFPRCVICLLGLDVPAEDVRGSSLGGHVSPHDTVDDGFIFCQTCRHGGHARHVLEWFFGSSDMDDSSVVGVESHDVCAVGDCDCRCADLF